jgi:hypothetical protein
LASLWALSEETMHIPSSMHKILNDGNAKQTLLQQFEVKGRFMLLRQVFETIIKGNMLQHKNANLLKLYLFTEFKFITLMPLKHVLKAKYCNLIWLKLYLIDILFQLNSSAQ